MTVVDRIDLVHDDGLDGPENFAALFGGHAWPVDTTGGGFAVPKRYVVTRRAGRRPTQRRRETRRDVSLRKALSNGQEEIV